MNQDQYNKLTRLMYGAIAVAIIIGAVLMYQMERLPIGCDMNSDDILSVKDVLLLAEQVKLK